MFSIGLKKEDINLLQEIKDYFGVGGIYMQGSEVVRYHVTSEKDL